MCADFVRDDGFDGVRPVCADKCEVAGRQVVPDNSFGAVSLLFEIVLVEFHGGLA